MSIEEIIKKRTYLIQTELGLSNRERNLIEFQMKELIKQLTLTDVSQQRELLNDSKSDEFYKELKQQKDDLEIFINIVNKNKK